MTTANHLSTLIDLVRKQFGPHAKRVEYSRDEHGFVTLWSVTDLGGRAVWDSTSPDVPDWPALTDAVDALAAATDPAVAGDGLRLKLVASEV